MVDRRRLLLAALAAAPLGAQGALERATAVDLSGPWVSDADLRRLAGMPSLERIDLSRTRITGKGLEHLRDLPHVTELNLQFAEFITAPDIGHLSNWHNLRTIDLRGTRVDSGVFERLSSHAALESLDISSTDVHDEGFVELTALGKLRELRCGANRLAGSALTLLKTLPALRRLDVGGYQRVDSGLWGLALNERNLERLGGLSQLESLSLRGAKLADRGSDRPGSELALKTELVGLEALASLTQLRALDLGDLPIQSPDLSWLPALTRLEQLDVDGAYQLDDAVMPYLVGLTALKRLNLIGTQISASAVAGFSQQRPDCRVIFWNA